MHASTRALTRQINVPFHGTDLRIVEHIGQPYTPMKPIVAGMGLTWHGQHVKLKANAHRWGILDLRIPSAGGPQTMICVPLRKLPGWLASIEPGKVKDVVIRDRVIMYQDSCDDALWRHWNERVIARPRIGNAKSTVADRADALRFATELVIDRHIPYCVAYRVMRLYAGTPSFRAMTCDQAASAAEFALRLLNHDDTIADWKRVELNKSQLYDAPEQLTLPLHPRLAPSLPDDHRRP
ncbi:phage antirepressor N-terminal domain-containing protein [Paraburkholderia tropica]|uniref:phage antirepressor N-terminal domain-containing protein n=1 Tax=Paraburkholderia tropica TaxID=92647 RepID=UPI0032B364FF